MRRFICWSVRDLGEVAYPSIKEVVLTRSRVVDHSAALLPKVFPNLETLCYEDGGWIINRDGVASPRAISKAILDLKKTLKHVELGTYDILDSLEPVDAADRIMNSLVQMEVLESLRFHASFIYGDDDDDDEDEEGSDEDNDENENHETHLRSIMRLNEFLPLSIQNLYIEGLQSSHLDDILALAQSAPCGFPKLAGVVLPGLEMSMEELVGQAFKEQGIKCTFEGVYMNQYACSEAI